MIFNNWEPMQGRICAAWNVFAHVAQSSVGLQGTDLLCCDISTAGWSNRCARLRLSWYPLTLPQPAFPRSVAHMDTRSDCEHWIQEESTNSAGMEANSTDRRSGRIRFCSITVCLDAFLVQSWWVCVRINWLEPAGFGSLTTKHPNFK